MSSVVATQRQRGKIVETGETIQMTSPDQVLLSGVLESGAVAVGRDIKAESTLSHWLVPS